LSWPHLRVSQILTLQQAFAHIGWKFYLVFIILSGLGAIVAFFVLPETKNIPLEEMAKLFGDDEVAVYAEDLHVDHNTHELVVDEHSTGMQRVATEAGAPRANGDVEKHAGAREHTETVEVDKH
jgi:hypothetical protein